MCTSDTFHDVRLKKPLTFHNGFLFFATSLVNRYIFIYIYIYIYIYVIVNRQGNHNIRNGIVWVRTGHSRCMCTVSLRRKSNPNLQNNSSDALTARRMAPAFTSPVTLVPEDPSVNASCACSPPPSWPPAASPAPPHLGFGSEVGQGCIDLQHFALGGFCLGQRRSHRQSRA